MSFTTHAAERAAERYGLTPTPAEWSRAVLDIIDTCAGDARSAILVANLPGGKERWIVKLGATPILVIYSPLQAVIITVTPVTPQHNRKRTGFVRNRNQWALGRQRTERAVAEDWGE